MSSTTMSSVLNTKLSFACNCTTIQHEPTISEDGLTVRVQQTIKLCSVHVVIPSPSAPSQLTTSTTCSPNNNPPQLTSLKRKKSTSTSSSPNKRRKKSSVSNDLHLHQQHYMEVLTLMNHHGISLTKSIQRLNY